MQDGSFADGDAMEPVTTVLVEEGGATALTLDPEGRIAGVGRGEDLWTAVRDTGAPADDVIVADERDVPRGVAIGVIDVLSLQSAERVLRLAGCDVAASLSVNDGLDAVDRIARIVEADPDTILLAGGTDGGDVGHVQEYAEAVAEARGALDDLTRTAPGVVFGGNPDARDAVRRILGADIHHEVDNIRPACERENLAPAVILIGNLAARPVQAERAGSPPPRTWTAGAARSAAVHDLARMSGSGVLLLHEGPDGAEAVSLLGVHWNRVVEPEAGLREAAARHRWLARELSGVALTRDVADAFAEAVPGRDLLDVAPPARIIGSGAAFGALPAHDAADRLVEVVRPRGVVRLTRTNGLDPALLGLAALGGHPVHFDAYDHALSDLALVVSVDGRACDVRVSLPGGEHVVFGGDLERFTVVEPVTAVLEPDRGGDIGLGVGRPALREVPVLPAGLIIDARGTPVPPERRVRILPH
jgi:hypothetical protein